MSTDLLTHTGFNFDAGGSRQRAASAGHRVLSRRIRRSSGTYNSRLSPESASIETPGELYCVCRQPYNRRRNMVQCDRCDDWFHPECVGLKDIGLISEDAPYFCPNCEAPPASRPRSASSAPYLSPADAGRLRSLSQSRKRPKVPGSIASPPEDSHSVSSRSSAQNIKREPLDLSTESCSLPNYLHTPNKPYSLRARPTPQDNSDSSYLEESGSSGRGTRSRQRYHEYQDPDDADVSELDARFASPTDSVLRAHMTRRRQRQAAFLPGLESLSIHTAELNGGYVVRGCPNSCNPFHTCTSYCACRWGGVSRIHEDSVARSPVFHDDADHKRVFHNGNLVGNWGGGGSSFCERLIITTFLLDGDCFTEFSQSGPF
jgi:hypothetical protein